MPKNDISPEETKACLNLINSEKDRKLIKFLFLDYLKQKELFAKIDPKRYKEYKKEYMDIAKSEGDNKRFRKRKKSANNNKMINAFKILKPNFVDELEVSNEKKFPFEGKSYRINLNFYFEYVKNKLSISKKKKLKKIDWMAERASPKVKKTKRFQKGAEKEFSSELSEKEFNETERKIINHIFDFREVREIVCKHENLIEGITAFLERIFLYGTQMDWPHNLSHFFRKRFFIRNQNYFKVTPEIYMDRLKEIEKFEKVSYGYFRKLGNKIKIISNFSDEEYFDLTTKTSLRKYQYMPSFKEIMKEIDPIKRQRLVRAWTQLYFFDEIPEGYS